MLIRSLLVAAALLICTAAQAEARRVVTLAPHLAELVCAAGGCERLVAVSAHSNFPPSVAKLTIASSRRASGTNRKPWSKACAVSRCRSTPCTSKVQPGRLSGGRPRRGMGPCRILQRPPAASDATTRRDSTCACARASRPMLASRAEAPADAARPPKQPSQLLAGLMVGAILCLPNGTPMSSPPTSVNFVATKTQTT